MKLYRIVSFETFANLLINKTVWYSSPSKWDDTFEGYLFGKMEKDEEWKDVVKFIHERISHNVADNTVYAFFQFLYAKNNSFAQCWSKCKESDALWRIYKYGNHSIQICSNNKKIEEAVREGMAGKPYALRKTSVKYDVIKDADTLEKQIIQTRNTLSVLEPYFHKRKAFIHEREYRIVILDETNAGILIDAATNKARRAMCNKDDLSNICDSIKEGRTFFNLESKQGMSIPVDPKKYITGVIANPFAEDWFVELVEEMCKRYRIPFDGKSRLYEKI